MEEDADELQKQFFERKKAKPEEKSMEDAMTEVRKICYRKRMKGHTSIISWAT